MGRQRRRSEHHDANLVFCRRALTFLRQVRTLRDDAIVAVRRVFATLLSAPEVNILLIARIEPARNGDDRDFAAATPATGLARLVQMRLPARLWRPHCR